MNDQNARACAHCGEPLKQTGKGRPAKVHAACRRPYDAARKRAKRLDEIEAEAEDRGMTVDEVKAERAERKAASQREWHARKARRSLRRALKAAGLMGASEGPYTRGGAAPLVGRTSVTGPPKARPATFDPNTGKFGKTADFQRPNFAGPRVWKRLIRGATARLIDQGITASTADVGRLFLQTYEVIDLQAALDAMRDLDAERWRLVTRLDRIDAVEQRFAEVVEAAGKAGIDIFTKTGDMAVLEAVTAIPGLGGLRDFSAASTKEKDVPKKTLTVAEQFAKDIASRYRQTAGLP